MLRSLVPSLLAGGAAAAAVRALCVVVCTGVGHRGLARARGLSMPRSASAPTLLRAAFDAGWTPAWLRRRVDDLALAVSADRIVGSWTAATAVVGIVLGAAGSTGAGVLAVAVSAVLAAAVLVLGRGRSTRLVERELPVLLDAVTSELRAGGSLRAALDAAGERVTGPLLVDVERLLARLRSGASFGEALAAWRRERTSRAVHHAAAALALAHEVGGAAASAIDGVAASRRDELAVAAELVALTTQARASAVVIVLAPLAFVGLAASADPTSLSFLTTTPVGLVCLGVGLLVDLVGAVWMAWLARTRA